MNSRTKRTMVGFAAIGLIGLLIWQFGAAQQPGGSRAPLLFGSPPTDDAYRASTPGADFIAAIGSLHELLAGPTLERALTSENRMAASEAVAQLIARIDSLYTTGKAYRQHEQELGRKPTSGFLINDTDMGDIRQLFNQYRAANTDDAKAATTESVKKLVKEFQEAYARHWPNDIGVVNLGPAVVNLGPAIDSSNTGNAARDPYGQDVRQRMVATEERQLADGTRYVTTGAVPMGGPRDPYGANQSAGLQPAATPIPNQYENSGPPNVEIRRAVEALRDAKDDAAKAAATEALTKLLNDTFDQDMRRREREVAQIEERVKNLRSQLDRRREKRQEIIDLQIKVLENEAAGLGFFGQSRELLIMDGSEAAPRARGVKLEEDDRVPAFNFDGQPWPSVLAWYAKRANCSLDWQVLPTGGVSLSTQRPISLDEVGRLLNRLLVARGFVFLQRDGLIQVMNIEDIDPSLVKPILEWDVYQRTMPPEAVEKLRQLETPPVSTSPPTMPRIVIPLEEAPATPPTPTTPFARYPAAQTRAKTNQARAQVKLLEQAVQMYHFSTKSYPAGFQELIKAPADAERARRWTGPYLRGDKPPLDPWGLTYRYVAPGIVNPTSFDVWSAGPDLQVGTADDIGNWDPDRMR